MTGASVPGRDRKISFHCIYCANVLKTYQTETKLVECSSNTKRKELNIIKTMNFGMASLQWLRWNGFRFSHSPMFTSKPTIFLDHAGYTGKYRPVVKDF